MEAISDAGVTLNPSKCVIGAKEIEFRGMLISSNGIHPNPAKVAPLNLITPPNNKEELTSFLCMMQMQNLCRTSHKNLLFSENSHGEINNFNGQANIWHALIIFYKNFENALYLRITRGNYCDH